MTAPEKRVNKLAEKYMDQRFRACIREERLHLRVGKGRRDDTEVAFVGTAAELHGDVCTCCKKRE